MNFQEFIDGNIKTATQVLQLRGRFSPQAVLCDENDNCGIALLAVDKQMWNKLLGKIVEQFKAKYVVLITETWFAEIEKPDEMVLPVRAHPFRKEALVLTSYAKTGEKDLAIIPFERVDPKTIVMQEIKRDSEFESNVFANPWA